MKNIFYTLICLLLLSGCSSVIHSIAHGGKNLGQAFTDPNGYDKRIEQEYLAKECPEAFHKFKEEYFKETVSLCENIYQTLQDTSYDSFIPRLKTEGCKDGNINFILKNNIAKNNSKILALIYDDVNAYLKNVKIFVEGIEKRKNYNNGYVGDLSVNLGNWPKISDKCNSFFDQEEYKKLVKNYKLVSILADNIYDYAYDLEVEDFHKKTKLYIGGTNNLLVPYMLGIEGNPAPNFIYFLNGLQVFQNISGGILVNLRREFGYSDKLIFVSTNRHFVDSASLDDIAVVLTGTKNYSTILGVNRTIFAFKIIDITPYKKIVQNYYFYPTFKKLDKNQITNEIRQSFIIN